MAPTAGNPFDYVYLVTDLSPLLFSSRRKANNELRVTFHSALVDCQEFVVAVHMVPVGPLFVKKA